MSSETEIRAFRVDMPEEAKSPLPPSRMTRNLARVLAGSKDGPDLEDSCQRQ